MDFNDEINVIRMQKKVFDEVPGSSPEIRGGIQDIQYRQKAGKAPMLEKRNSKI